MPQSKTEKQPLEKFRIKMKKPQVLTYGFIGRVTVNYLREACWWQTLQIVRVFSLFALTNLSKSTWLIAQRGVFTLQRILVASSSGHAF
jgi:hypothetical protein